jgi:hypothetical protein
MFETNILHMPTLQQLLSTEVMAEAQIVVGSDFSQRQITQVTSSVSTATRPGSLLVVALHEVSTLTRADLINLAAVIVLGSNLPEQVIEAAFSAGAASAGSHAGLAGANPLAANSALEALQELCLEMLIPLIVLPTFGELNQIFEDIRVAFIKEVRNSAASLHEHLLKTVLTLGLDGLVEEVSTRTGRPSVVETAAFEVLASHTLAGTPTNQKQTLLEQLSLSLSRSRAEKNQDAGASVVMAKPIRLGRRLVAPIIVDSSLAGFLSCAVKSDESLDLLSDYLQTAATAAAVDFYKRKNDGTVFSVTQKSLLKDLLLGRQLSAADQERLERQFGFDLCDGLLVSAIHLSNEESHRIPEVFEEQAAVVEVEGTHIVVRPSNQKDEKTWLEMAEELKTIIKRASAKKSPDLKVQIGVGRSAPNILSLSEAYREARQTLIIGRMIHGEEEFTLNYAELGVKRLLYLIIDHPELQRFYEENLKLLEEYDAEWDSELIASLRVYLSQGANLNSAARALFIHRHTMNYRLEQIADILKIDIDAQEILLNLQIAFLIRDMKLGVNLGANAAQKTKDKN